MTDVFIRVFSSSELRLGFAIAAVARWKMQKDVNVHVLRWIDGLGAEHDWADRQISLPNDEIPFATRSLHAAEDLAQSDVYIICNDDNLILGQDFVANGLRVMEKNPDFGCISGVVSNSDGFDLSKELVEIHAVGGLVFLRKGLVTEFPPLEDGYWDLERHRQVTEKGFRSGYTRECPYLHMGAKFSTNPAFFVGA